MEHEAIDYFFEQLMSTMLGLSIGIATGFLILYFGARVCDCVKEWWKYK